MTDALIHERAIDSFVRVAPAPYLWLISEHPSPERQLERPRLAAYGTARIYHEIHITSIAYHRSL